MLGSGQVFGEVSVLDANQLSPVTVIAYTNVEMYAISKEHLHAQHASFNVAMNNFLNESMMMHNPPQQKIAQYLRNRLRWERNKTKILENMMPAKVGAARARARARAARECIYCGRGASEQHAAFYAFRARSTWKRAREARPRRKARASGRSLARPPRRRRAERRARRSRRAARPPSRTATRGGLLSVPSPLASSSELFWPRGAVQTTKAFQQAKISQGNRRTVRSRGAKG